MNQKQVLWHGFADRGADQIASAKRILELDLKSVIDPKFGLLIHRSNPIVIPRDERLPGTNNGKSQTRPQEWHFNWRRWTKALVLTPRGQPYARFAIGTYCPALREIRICSEIRRIQDGSFAMRLDGDQRTVLVFGERQIGLRSGGIIGGDVGSETPLPSIDLY